MASNYTKQYIIYSYILLKDTTMLSGIADTNYRQVFYLEEKKNTIFILC